MSFVFYAVLMVVSLSSVVFGLEWLSEAPPVWKPVAVASVKQPVGPVAKLPVQAAAKPTAADATATGQAASSQASTSEPSGETGTAGVPQTSRSTPDDTSTVARLPAAGDIMAPEPGTESASATEPRCDVQACTAAYRSFRVSDCTWQPFDGPRRFCDKGTPPEPDTAQTAEQAPASAETAAADRQVSNKCDIEACRQAYFTFNPADCTYQPSDGPRRLCTKGTPPRPGSAQAPAQDAETDKPAATAGTSTSTESEPAARPTPLCDLQACTAAYFTFNPADCTYQPSDGPRRLCTKGTPPPRDAAQAPGEAPEAEEGEAAASVGAAPPSARAPACNVQACAAAYFTFDPTDCTYQPSNGPRRLCTK
jgi:hypothetical protein